MENLFSASALKSLSGSGERGTSVKFKLYTSILTGYIYTIPTILLFMLGLSVFHLIQHALCDTIVQYK